MDGTHTPTRWLGRPGLPQGGTAYPSCTHHLVRQWPRAGRLALPMTRTRHRAA
jgi:hypothetical protein